MNLKYSLEDIFYAKADEHGMSLDLSNPKTLTDKMIWLELYDPSNHLKPICADKIGVREYAKEKLGKDICVPLIKVYESPEEFSLSELPSKFVLKSSNSYNQNLICTDKNNLNETDVRTKMKNWGSVVHGINTCEPHYLYIQRRYFAEKFISTKGQKDLVDYKFLCFNGQPKYMQLIQDRHGPNKRLQYYDMNMKFVDICRNDFKNRPDMKSNDVLPKCFDLMKEYATKLAAPFKFVRVDFYEVGNKVYLGEMTFTPGTCFIKYKNPNTDRMLGDMLKL